MADSFEKRLSKVEGGLADSMDDNDPERLSEITERIQEVIHRLEIMSNKIEGLENLIKSTRRPTAGSDLFLSIAWSCFMFAAGLAVALVMVQLL